jgi:hypothetical protein
MPGHRQYLLQASDEYEMNEWINLLNYGSAFKSANMRIRGTSMGKDRAVLAGAAAAASHKRDAASTPVPPSSESKLRTPRRAVRGATADNSPEDRPAPAFLSPEVDATPKQKGLVDVQGANDVVVDAGEQLEEVFDVVKAELAAGRGGATRTDENSVAHAKTKSGRDADNSRATQMQVSSRYESTLRGRVRY